MGSISRFNPRRELIAVAKEAGVRLLEDFKRGKGREISKHKPVSPSRKEDDKLERLIIESLRRRGFEGVIFSEERDSTSMGKLRRFELYIDPLDGSTNFSRGIPHFSISIALEDLSCYRFKLHTPLIFGTVINPNKRELFEAQLNKGATLNGQRVEIRDYNEKYVVVGVNQASAVSKLVSGEKQRIHIKARVYGSTALDLCYVACGRFEASVAIGAKPYDIAAGILIAKEAGAIVTDLEGVTASIHSENIIASSSPELHRSLLRSLK